MSYLLKELRFEFTSCLGWPPCVLGFLYAIVYRNCANYLAYCWFACDVTAAMLMVKKKTFPLLWELNSIFT